LTAWVVLGALLALVIGKSIRLADRCSTPRDLSPADPANVAAPVGADHDLRATVAAASPSAGASRAARRRVPLPPVGVALAGFAVLLESIGFVLALSGATGRSARLLSMDAPLAIPRMYVAGLFAAAAVAALIAATRIPGRRGWWAAVGLVGAGISVVKAGGTVHAAAMHGLSRTVGSAGAQVVAALLAGAVVGTLWYLARAERRDRLRVLGSLAFYAVAAVGLSAVSADVGGARAATVATFVEESGEALAAVAFLLAVLVGVAPRLVLPADWALRRSADAHTLDAVDPISEERRAAGWR
jgi:hypothetical protein